MRQKLQTRGKPVLNQGRSWCCGLLCCPHTYTMEEVVMTRLTFRRASISHHTYTMEEAVMTIRRASRSHHTYTMEEAVMTIRRASRRFLFSPVYITMIFIDNQMDTVAREQLISSYCHAILAFIVPALLSLVQVKYQGKADSPFDTHPATIIVAIASLLIYCLVYAVELKSSIVRTTCARGVVCYIKCLLGLLSLASVASILLPGLPQPVLYAVYLLLAGGIYRYALVQKLCQWVRQRIAIIRARPILPLTTMDVR